MENTQQTDLSYEELLVKNKTLSAELQQCVQDKEFVWSLWKELQLANPNTTALVNSVLKREQEKSDAKDLKVLNVLKDKDGQLQILQEISVDLQTQLLQSNERIAELLIQNSEHEKLKQSLNKDILKLQTEYDLKDQVLAGRDEVFAKKESTIKQQVIVLEEKIEEISKEDEKLHHKLKVLDEELKSMKELDAEKDRKLFEKNQKLKEFKENLDAKCEEVDVLSTENKDSKKEISKLKLCFKQKSKEIEDARVFWENEVTKNTGTIESQCARLREQQEHLLSLQKELGSHETCLKRIEEQTKLIEKLEGLQDESQKILVQQQSTYDAEANLQKKTIKNLKKKFCDLQKETVKIACQQMPSLSQNGDFFSISDTNVDKCTQTISVETKDGTDLSTIREGTEPYNEMLINLIKSMEANLETTKVAHQRRCERYKWLEENFKLLSKQLATYEEDGVKKNNKEIARASNKSLSQESSRSVWNELEYYRQEYEKCKLIRPKLEEELDKLKVGQAESQTKICQMKVEMGDLSRLFKEKELLLEERNVEVDCKDQELQKTILEVKNLQKENKSCYDKLSFFEKDYCDLQKIYKAQIEREELLRKEMDSLLEENLKLKDKKVESTMIDKETQINFTNDNLMKEKEVQTYLEEVFKSSVPENLIEKSISKAETSTQTLEDVILLQQQEKILRLEDEREIIVAQNQKLQDDNRTMKEQIAKLKQKKLTLQDDLCKIMEDKQTLEIYASSTEKTNEKLKVELMETLQQLKEAGEMLEYKSKLNQDLSKNLETIVASDKKGTDDSKKKLKKIKLLEKELVEISSKSSEMSFKMKTLQGENEILSKEQKIFQERVGKLEKDLIKKKTLIEDLNASLENLRGEVVQKDDQIDKLKIKIKTLSGRESSTKNQTCELKSKIDALLKDKVVLQDTLAYLTTENNNKTELLQKTQHLCHQAETAINEMEHSSTFQIQNNEKIYTEKYKTIFSAHEKCAKVKAGYKAVVQAIAEAFILRITRHQKKILEIKKMKKKKKVEEKQANLFEKRCNDVACSILGMSNQDLLNFMNEEDFEESKRPQYDTNDMKNKWNLIFINEFNFEDAMKRFLLDLFTLNDTLLEELVLEK